MPKFLHQGPSPVPATVAGTPDGYQHSMITTDGQSATYIPLRSHGGGPEGSYVLTDMPTHVPGPVPAERGAR